MKVIPLRCNHCGAPLEAPKSAKFITCGFCESALAIQATGNSYTTRLLEEIQETTSNLKEQVDRLEVQADLRDLDDRWERERKSHLVKDKHGHLHEPNPVMAVIVGGAMVMFALFWMSQATRMGAPFAGFGLIFIIAPIAMAIHSFHKADQLKKARRDYRRRRREVMNRAVSNDTGD